MRARRMWKTILLLLCLSGYCCAVPLGGFKRNMPIVVRENEPMIVEPGASQQSDAEKPAPEPLAPEMQLPATLTLPSNATSIRADITDNFSCDNKAYGYYADVDNDCQIFHVCLPVTYADGKENTFRWSFICPEETIFSQDSFTCMRREDMAIECDDSVSYYELNQNFGMTDEDKISNMPTTNEQQASASATDEQQEQQPQQQPEANEPIMQMSVASAPEQQAKPMKPKEKPAKVPKPNRRKPQPQSQSQSQASIRPTNKLPNIAPLRKMPQVGPVAPAVVSVRPQEVASVEKEEVKPLTQRYKTRPAATSTVIKEKVQPVKAESTAQNVDSHKRKRPTYPYIKDTTVPKVDAEPIVEVTQSVSSPAPLAQTVKFEAPVAAVSAPVPAPVSEEVEKKPVEQAPLEVPNAVKTTPEVDAVPQASETAEVVVKPEDVLKTTDEQTNANDQAEPEPAKEPEVLSESVAEVDGKPETSEPAAPAEAAAEPTDEEAPKAGESELQQTNEKAAKPEASQAPLEAIEAIPAVILETEESKPDESVPSSNVKIAVAIEDEKPADAMEPKPESGVDQPESTADEEKPAENADVTAATEPLDKPDAPAAPAIFEANSEEDLPAAPTLEEMEDAKPADAVETMQAAPEMEQHDPVVQQMFEDNNEHLQSVGGFKPVDPALAAEAEALITDFLMTLKSDGSHARPILPIEMAEQIPAASAESEDIKDAANKETEKTETEDARLVGEPEAPKEPAVDATALMTAAAGETEAAPQPEPEAAEPQPMENGAPLPNMLMMNSFPGDMYQIPVKVIQTPIEMAQEADAVKSEAEVAEAEQPSKQPEPERVAYRPISIDDIVELVKERLDQVPANEKGAPMELVMEPMVNEQTSAEDKLEQLKTVAAESAVQPESAEDIIFPIYNRLSEVNSNVVKSAAQEVDEPGVVKEEPAVVVEQVLPQKAEAEKEPAATAEKSAQTNELELESNIAKSEIETDPEVTAAVAEATNKANRAYRSRSLAKAKMDPRKRRFLFRSDVS